MTTTLEQNGTELAARPRADMRALAVNTPNLKVILESASDKMAMVVPKHLTPERLIRVALVAVSRSELLQKCTAGSILQCVMTGAQLGLDCSGVLGSAYMVPFYNSKVGAYEATFIPGYRGLIDLARRSGEIEDIFAHVVYKDDAFDLELGADTRLTHRPNLSTERTDANIVGAYMVAYLKGTTRPHVEFMPRTDIDKIRERSQSGMRKTDTKTGESYYDKRSPWNTDYAEMARKTVVRRGIKYLPLSVELQQAATLVDQEYPQAQVVAAQTGPVRNAEMLMQRLTSRPVSEGQTFEADPDALAAAQNAEVCHAAEGAGESAPAPVAEHREPDTSGAEAEKRAADGGDDLAREAQERELVEQLADAHNAERVYLDAMATGGASRADGAKALGAYMLKHRLKGKLHLMPREAALTLYQACAAGRVMLDGSISAG